MLIQPRRTYIRAVTGGSQMSDSPKEVTFTLRDTDEARRALQRGAYRMSAARVKRWAKKPEHARLREAMLEVALLLEVEAASLTTRIPDVDDCFGTETIVIMIDDPTAT